ncbi:MAG TPA: type III pantothenate kinase [Thiotrichales bacterium]|nr:type III pantothenate kinase [Thiotrichales bacterium]
MILTFDIGNSRIKWASWQDGEMTANGAVESTADALDALMSHTLATQPSPQQVQAVCVAGEALAGALQQGVARQWALDVVFFHTTGKFAGRHCTLVNAYADVSKHGADRWAGLIAASDDCAGDLCVISAGTAITMDLLRSDGRHLGGRILPSMTTLYDALLQSAPAIPVTGRLQDNGPEPALFADNTEEAIRSGCFHLLASGLREACEQAATVLDEPVFYLTGGLAETLQAFPGMPVMRHQPALILQGVYIALAEPGPNKASVNKPEQATSANTTGGCSREKNGYEE